MGPYLIHKSVVNAPNALHIETVVNGEVRQTSNTNKMIFSIEEIISTISKGMTLEPGDIIATGTRLVSERFHTTEVFTCW